MRSDVVVIACVRLQNLAQMHLAQDNDVVHTFTPDRSDQPFGKAILPGRGWRGRLVPDAHGAKSACDNAPIDPIPIADEVVRSLIPGKGLRYLTCNHSAVGFAVTLVQRRSLRPSRTMMKA